MKENNLKVTGWEKPYLYTTTVEDYPVITYGNGTYVQDLAGNILLDATAQVGVAGLGQCDSRLVSAVEQQLKISSSLLSADFAFKNNIVVDGKNIEISRVALAKKLIDMAKVIMPGRNLKVMTEATGSLAVNASAILAKITHLRNLGWTTDMFNRYHKQDILLPGWIGGPFSCNFLSFAKAFHGRHNYASLLSDSKAIHKWALSSSCGVGRLTVPYPGWRKKDIRRQVDDRIELLEKWTRNKVIAFYFEPILGEGGIIVPEKEGMKFLVDYLREKGIWIIADEIQTGLGRAGKMFCCEHYGIEPDMVLLSKSLAGGIPIAAVIADSDKFPDLEKGMHSGSFHWVPVAVAAAIVNLSILEECIPRVEEIGDFFINSVKEICSNHMDIVEEVRGKGYMVGVEFKTVERRDEFVGKAKTGLPGMGLLLHTCGDKALRFYPRINADIQELEMCLTLFKNTFDLM